LEVRNYGPWRRTWHIKPVSEALAQGLSGSSSFDHKRLDPQKLEQFSKKKRRYAYREGRLTGKIHIQGDSELAILDRRRIFVGKIGARSTQFFLTWSLEKNHAWLMLISLKNRIEMQWR
jgi:hypothetical protein